MEAAEAILHRILDYQSNRFPLDAFFSFSLFAKTCETYFIFEFENKQDIIAKSKFKYNWRNLDNSYITIW